MKLNQSALSRASGFGSLVDGAPTVLKLLSYNIQAAIGTSSYHHYVTRSWRNVVPHSKTSQILNQIARIVSDYDVVALQEADGGSLRSRFVNQIEYLAEYGGFKVWHQQLNRDFGRLGQFSNGLLSRYIPYQIENHKLPGLRGRGAIVATFGHPDTPLVLVGLHLALGERARNKQLEYVCDVVRQYEYVVVMGDMNCRSDQLMHSPLKGSGLAPALQTRPTFPSWRPSRNIDHMLVTPGINVRTISVLDYAYSDHLPLSMEIVIPEAVCRRMAH